MKIRGLILGTGLLVTLASAQAGPPFATDDPEPPPPGGWEINVPFILERTPGRTEMDSPLFDLNYGLPNVQLKLEIPVKVGHVDADGTMAGAGDLLVGMKWRFLNNEQSKFQLGVYPQLLLPTGIARADSARVGLPLCSQSSCRKVGTNGRSTAISVFGGRQLAKRAITFTPAQCWNVRSTNG